MDPVISVIVPVYNVESYLAQSIESIVRQTYASLEIILIDDGSTDFSGLICDEFAKKDNRIKVIHQKNAGAAAARNAGLDISSGAYLAFVDSDDWLESDAFAYMADELQKNQADIIQCSFRDVYVNRQSDYICKAEGRTFDQISYLGRFTEDWTCGLLWDKLYKRELFQAIRFETGHVIDDEYFTYQGVMNAGTIICRDKIVYNYRKRRSGATGNPEHYDRIIADKLDYLTKRLDKISERYPSLEKIFNRHFLYMICWLSEENEMTVQSLKLVQSVLCERWKQCRNSGEGWRTDMQLKRLMRADPVKLLQNRSCQPHEELEADQMFA